MANDHFDLLSSWRIAAPVAQVWQALREPERWPSWWPYVLALSELDAGATTGVGARHLVTWTSRLPYSIKLTTTVTEVVEASRIEIAASGDLIGAGTWSLQPAGDRLTVVEYRWRVRLDKPWMRWLAPLLRPAFAWNHHAVMAAGERGLRRYLATPA